MKEMSKKKRIYLAPNKPNKSALFFRYTGVVSVLLVNNGKEVFKVEIGAKIAQLVILRTENVKMCDAAEVGKVKEPKRGAQGWGHSDR